MRVTGESVNPKPRNPKFLNGAFRQGSRASAPTWARSLVLPCREADGSGHSKSAFYRNGVFRGSEVKGLRFKDWVQGGFRV